ncbi:hypothetical protein [Paucibacter sp. M5-1]|uniref:hypothetical protein n=1 Tax=Paucibacter sp. M5-1 TaxID=3015998 RepID=UPI0022B863A6|nr:hypothetical protein [Paucibacter sp. M5-1]MCZ7881234.1 hypothetical protein [Paucibacter sp. M5-1]
MKTSFLVNVQIVVALVAVAATVFASRQLVPVTEQLVALKSEVVQLEAKKIELQRTNSVITANATPATSVVSAEVGWVYVGRVNSDRVWAPPAEGVAPAPNEKAVENFKEVMVSKNTPYVDNADAPKVDIAEFNPSTSSGPVRLVRAGTSLPVLDVRREASAGGASLVWAKVSIPAKAILEIQGRS